MICNDVEKVYLLAGLTYARARLWLGIVSVGTLVVLAVAGLVLRLPARISSLFPEGWLGDSASLLVFLLLYVAVTFPFDLIGGWLLPRRYGRSSASFAEWWGGWLRGVLAQILVYFIGGLLLVTAGRLGGTPGGVAMAGALMLLLIAFQWRLARVVGGFRGGAGSPSPADARTMRLEAAMASDPGFVGGWVGFPGRERLVVPAHWAEVLRPDQMAAQLARRRVALESGSRQRGLLLAIVWNLTGLSLCSLMPGAGFGSVEDLLATILWFVLWSFLGLLILPTPSRAGVYECDRGALAAGVARGALEGTIRALDRLQEDEAGRPAGIERIFHPVPSVANRLAGLDAALAPRGAWHAARTTLYLSWACLGLLARAVHCNCGRPQLWVMFPGD